MEEFRGDWVYMMDVWTKCTVGDVCSTVSETYRRKSPKVILINTSDVLKGKVLNHNYVDNVNLKGQFKKTFQKYDILFSEIRPANERYAFIDFDDTQDYIASTKLMVIRPMKEKILPLYLYFILKSKNMLSELQSLAETRSGTFPQITFDSELSSMPIMLPNMDIQEKIITILKSIDDKIATNTAINKNLESQAQAIFKSWFVDFEPFGGEMPRDWKYGNLEDLGQDIVCGKTPSTKRKEYYGGNIPFVTIPDMHNQIYITETERYLSIDGVKTQPTKTLPKNTICVSCIGTAGLVSLTSKDCQTNQQINSIIPKDHISPYYVYFLMKSLSETIIRLGGSGSTIVNLNKGQFAKIEVVIPNLEDMSKFTYIVKSNFEMILSNQIENTRLAALRDTLLPRLMSGEIDVGNIEL